MFLKKPPRYLEVCFWIKEKIRFLFGSILPKERKKKDMFFENMFCVCLDEWLVWKNLGGQCDFVEDIKSKFGLR